MAHGESTPGPAALEVLVVNRQRRRRVRPSRLRRILRGAAQALGVGGEVALVLTGDRTVRPLNARYRGKDRPTDVLSFPGPCAEHVGSRRPGRASGVLCPACEEGTEGLGDILISVEAAERNARGLGRTLHQELDVLALHGFLHVLGYDHETDDGTMDRLERRLRQRLLNARARRSHQGRGA